MGLALRQRTLRTGPHIAKTAGALGSIHSHEYCVCVSAGYSSYVLKVFTSQFHVEILCFHNCYLPSKSFRLLLPRRMWPALADHCYLSTQKGSWIEPQSQHCTGYNKNKFILVFLSLSPGWRYTLVDDVESSSPVRRLSLYPP